MRFKFGLVSLLVSFLLLISLAFALPVTAASSQYGTKGNTTSKVVALTFDDGADGKNITKILQILNTNKIKSIFFITGKAAENSSDSKDSC